jgi:glutamate synthase (NADPH/NADH) large chain
VLRAKYDGKPEFVENYFRFVAEEVRELMALLGFRSIDEMIGRVDKIDVRQAVAHWKAGGLDLSSLLVEPDAPAGVERRCVQAQDHGLAQALDNELIKAAEPA